jgi:hypothetical protein
MTGKRQFVPPSRRTVRVPVGVLWLIDAGLQTQPALFGADWWRNDLAQSVMGQPIPINHSIFYVVGIVAAHAAAWNAVFVAIQAALGLALVSGRFERAAIVASIPWALGIWWVGEGFGALPTGFALSAAGAPGPVLLYPLIGLLAWPHPSSATPDGPARDEAPVINWRGGVTAWLLLWVGESLLQIPWAFPPRQTLLANISESSAGQPAWLRAIAHGTNALAGQHPTGVTVIMALSQLAVGVGVLHPRSRRTALGAGVALSMVYWVAFQYLGGIAGGDGTDPGTAPIMILLAFALWPSPNPDRPPTTPNTSGGGRVRPDTAVLTAPT